MIVTPGLYKLRNGMRARVSHIDTGPFTFPAKGSILRKGRAPEYCIWTINGRFGAAGTNPRDLAERIGD